jgi:glycine/D-amino acid oxidase-like deaminating enzyme/nitrite reductase/ring-hydroxylating ferredoxin subunit
MVSRNPTSELEGEPRSLWIDRSRSPTFDALDRQLSVDVAVVGGGIAGLTTATLLKDAGKTVAVIEADRVGGGVTGHSTAKITAAHGLMYNELASSVGKQRARNYAEANATAIERIAALADAHNIDCAFERLNAYTYTRSADDRSQIKAEVEAASRLGLSASFTEDVPVPFEVEAAVCIPDQAQFNPTPYLQGLAADLSGEGSYVFENTKATDLTTDQHPIVWTTATNTKDGTKDSNSSSGKDGKETTGAIRARNVVVASHFPFYDPALYFARMYPKRSYLLAVRVKEAATGMCYQTGGPYDYRTLRPYPTDGEPGMLIGGEGHKAGQGGDTTENYRRLEQYAHDHFDVESIDFRWSTQDYVTVDSIPYIGQLAPQHDNLYVATGFGAWGITNGTAAGVILRDLILDERNCWAETFDPSRLTIGASAKTFAEENANVGRRFTSDWVSGLRSGVTDSIAPGESEVMRTEGKPTAIHRDEEGEIHAVSAVCPHLDCIVQWNNAEGTWDCPCHGSRFGVDGDLIVGPAVEDLPQRNDEETIEANSEYESRLDSL